MADKKPDLDAAYALKTPDDSKALYAQWALTYDATFAQAMDFVLPDHVARLFSERGGQGPVLDVGAGTGLVGEKLNSQNDLEIDALDISPEMLDMARSKNVYRSTVVADLTKPLSIPDSTYKAVVSSGTFTHGHVGPDALDELLRLAKSGALFVLSINAEHFESRGFARKFESFGNRINGFSASTDPIYGASALASHKKDMAFMTSFTKG